MAKLGLKGTSRRINRQEEKKKVEKIVESLHKEDKKSLLIRLSPELHKRLKIKSAIDEISINEFVSNLIEDALLSDKRLNIA